MDSKKNQPGVEKELEIKEYHNNQHADDVYDEIEMRHQDVSSEDNLNNVSISSKLEVESATDSSSRKRSYSSVVQEVFRCRKQWFYFQPVKRSRYSFDDAFRFRGRDNSGPISTGASFSQLSTEGMFDDAEGDISFEIKKCKKPTNSSGIIRPDLVAAILGSPPIPNTRETPSSMQKDAYLDTKNRRGKSKKQKKRSTEKEKAAAAAILDGEVDLLEIFPRDDCDFLGRKCYIFTLRHLEWILHRDNKFKDSSARQEAYNSLTRKLKQIYVATPDSKEAIRRATNRSKSGSSTGVSIGTLTIPVPGNEASHSKALSIAEKLIEVNENEDFFVNEKIRVWKRLIETWKQKKLKSSERDQFPLVGPMSVFFPLGTLQFLESVGVKLLFDFLCLKKTESGLVLEMFRAWRKKCGLKDLNLLPLAKHLTGINARIEAGLKRKLGSENDMAKWITGPMVVLSGAAKEFIVDYSRIFSGNQFIETKTKDLADRLSDWRSTTGLPSLKGSGNVAMVSAWKTQIKDELELEKSLGKVFPEEEIRNEIELLSDMIVTNNGRRQCEKEIKKRRPEQLESKSDQPHLAANQALNSKEFFAECIGDKRKMAMFKSVGITTAQRLIGADKGKNSDLLKAVIAFKSEQNNGKEIQIASCISLLYDWTSRIKRKICDIAKDKSDVGNIPGVTRDLRGSRKWKKKSESMDPFDALSASSKKFLVDSMNICSASEFLATRTTDIANAFIKWREDKGMSTLKGLGAVASISGWKKLVRIKAASMGDPNLAELNRGRNTKSVVGETEIKHHGERAINELEHQLGTNATTSNEAKELVPVKLESRKIFSVLSCTRSDVFHFELENRNANSKGYESHIRYLGSDPASAFNVTVHANMKDEIDCISFDANINEEVVKIRGRQPYDSLTHGGIEIRAPGSISVVQTNEKENDDRASLKEVIRMFVLQGRVTPGWSKPFRGPSTEYPGRKSVSPRDIYSSPKAKNTQEMFNLFEVLRNGEKCYVLYIIDRIERGQSVRLHLSPLRHFDVSLTTDESKRFDVSMTEEDHKIVLRKLIQDRLNKLPVAMLLETLRYLKTELAVEISKYSAFVWNDTKFPTRKEQSNKEPLTATELVLARRRIHWVTVKVYENLRSIRTEHVSRYILTDLLWTQLYADKIRDKLKMDNISPDLIREEIGQELKYEFMHRGFNGFSSTIDLWCLMARKLFNEIVDLFARFSIKFGSACVGEALENELICLVSRLVVDLSKQSHDLQDGETKKISNLALMYNEGAHHSSNLFPSFEQIAQSCFLQPYKDAMLLCSEPVSSLDFIKDVRILAMKYLYEPVKDGETYFVDLQDAKISKKCSIDLHWYVNTQILAVAKSIIQCGILISTPEDRTDFFRKLDSKLVEAAHKELAEERGEKLLYKDFEMQQRAVYSIMQGEVTKSSAFFDRSLSTPSSLPFFFGLIWPLLHNEGWKLIAGRLPSDVSFVPPDEMGISSRTYHPKDSLARQRLHLAKETCTYGLGYTPKLTKRLVIKCWETNDKLLRGDESTLDHIARSPSTKVVLEAFTSSLQMDIEKFCGSTFGTEHSKIKNVVHELLCLFNKLAPLTFEKEDECNLSEGKQWCDVLDSKYLFKFLIIMPDLLKDANLIPRQYKNTISVIHELLAFLSNNHHEVLHECLELSDEEYDSESNFPSSLISQLMNIGQMNIVIDSLESKHLESEGESVETIHPEDRVNLTDFVAIVMGQTIIRKSAIEYSNRLGRYAVGHPCIVCRHCLGLNGGRYFYGSYESIATATTAIEKHVLRCTKVAKKTKEEVMNAKMRHSRQRENLPRGAQGAFFTRLYDRMKSMQSMAQPCYSEFSSTEVCPFESANGIAAQSSVGRGNSNIPRAFSSHVDVMSYVQTTEPWKSLKPLDEMTSKYYYCLDYGGRFFSMEENHSEMLLKKLTSNN